MTLKVYLKGWDNRYYEKNGNYERNISKEIPFICPKGWTWTRLNRLCSFIQYGLSYSASEKGNNPYLRITDIQNGLVKWNSLPFVTIKDNEKQYYLKMDDIVFARTGATVGKSFLIKENLNNTVFASYLIRIRLVYPEMSDYIYMFFNSKFYWDAITDLSVGTGQPNCNGTKLANLLIPIPPYKEQKKIMEKIARYIPLFITLKNESTKLKLLANKLKQKVLFSIFSSSDKSHYRKSSLGNELKYIQPGPFIVNTTDYSPNYSTPVLTPGKSFILGYTNEKEGIFHVQGRKIIIFDDFTTASKIVDFDFKVKSSAMKILVTDNKKNNIEYLFYYLQTIKINSDTHKRFWISEFAPLEIYMPTLEEQTNLSTKINKSFSIIDKIINDK